MTMELKKRLKKLTSILSLLFVVGCSYYSMAGSLPPNINNVRSTGALGLDE